MPTVEIAHPGFGGLSLADQPGSIDRTGARIAENIELVGERTFRPRYGSLALGGGASINDQGRDLFVIKNGFSESVALWFGSNGGGTYGPGPAAQLTIPVTVSNPRLWWDAATVGTTVGTMFFFSAAGSFSDANEIVRRYSAATHAIDTPAGTKWDGLTNLGALSDLGHPSVLGVWDPDSRLILGGFKTATPNQGPGGATGLAVDRDTLLISNPADPTSFDIFGYMKLGVGDGEHFTAIVNYREMTFIFKQTRFWVLTGIGNNAEGRAQFFSRPVSLSMSDGPSCPGGVAVGRNGVYFVTPSGVWRTSGSSVTRISDAIAPFFLEEGFRAAASVVSTGTMRLKIIEDKLYLTVNGTRGWYCFVYDLRREQWVRWVLPVAQFGSFDGALIFLDSGVTQANTLVHPRLWVMTRSRGGDFSGAGAGEQVPQAVAWRWRSSSQDFGSPRVKRLVGHQVQAGGSARAGLALRVFSDYVDTATPASLPVTLIESGSASDLEMAQGFVRHGYHGRSFQVQLEGSNNGTVDWTPMGGGVQGLIHHVRGMDGPETVTRTP